MPSHCQFWNSNKFSDPPLGALENIFLLLATLFLQVRTPWSMTSLPLSFAPRHICLANRRLSDSQGGEDGIFVFQDHLMIGRWAWWNSSLRIQTIQREMVVPNVEDRGGVGRDQQWEVLLNYPHHLESLGASQNRIIPLGSVIGPSLKFGPIEVVRIILANRSFFYHEELELNYHILIYCLKAKVLLELIFSLFVVRWVFPSMVRETLLGWNGQVQTKSN